MSGIFDFFGNTQPASLRPVTISDSNGAMQKPTLRLGVPGSTPAKIFGSARGKPKGLSMRSISDLNVNTPIVSGAQPSLKEQKSTELLKPKITQLDTSGNPVSPRSKERNAKGLKYLSKELLSPKHNKLVINKSSPSFTFSQDHIFKKPFTPAPINNKFYPEPEKLAYYYDEEENYLNAYDTDLKSECDELIAALTRPNQSHEDEGFESDPEMLPDIPTLSSLKIYAPDSPERVNTFPDDSLELPEISDEEF